MERGRGVGEGRGGEGGREGERISQHTESMGGLVQSVACLSTIDTGHNCSACFSQLCIVDPNSEGTIS